MIGQTLAHYEISALLGKGGMGEVYRARDTKLEREVALKLLPPDFAQDPHRLARFQREARVLASLSHPHIASIHGFEVASGHHFLVMELAEGEDLALRLERSAIPLDDALVMAEQMAQGLEAAHESNVVHRDLKPANVKIDADGNVKLLDFGLARAISGSVVDESDPMHSPTITAAFTQEGTILGTAAYMSPEQARGKTVDRRADIWAFGVVLFEMLSGERLFAGETTSDTLASVIKEEPDWDQLPDDVPPMVSALIRRCLEKDPRSRLQSIGEARIAIAQARLGADGGTLLSTSWSTAATGSHLPSDSAPASSRRPLWIVALVAVALLAFFAGRQLTSSDPEPRLRRFVVQPEGLQISYPTQPALSPDGRRIAYFEGTALRIRDLHDLEAAEVIDSDGATAPCWSADGQWLAFGLQGRIYKVSAEGGRPDVICDVDFTTLDGSDWGDDGQIYLAPDSGPIYVVPDRGGDAVPLFELGPGESDYHTPTVLPGGRGILFTTHDNDGRETIEVFSGGERKVILKIPGARLEYATWSSRDASDSRGYVIYHRLNTNPGVWALPFDLDALEATGDPVLLDSDGAFPSISDDGALLYASNSSAGPQQFALVDREGQIVERLSQPQDAITRFAISPDGGSILVEADEAGNTDIWLHDIERGTRTRLTFGPDAERNPGWMSDAQEFHYSTEAGGGRATIYAAPVNGAGEARPLAQGYGVSVSAASEWMAYVYFDANTTNDLYRRRLDSDEEPEILLKTNASEIGPRVSPDGRFVVYMSNASGGNQIYLKTFPTGDGLWQVSTEGGAWPKWSHDGTEILYRSGAGGSARMMSVSFQSDPMRLGTPEVIFEASDAPTLHYLSGFGAYEAMPDSDLLLMIERVGNNRGPDATMIFVEDWWAAFGLED